MNPVVLHLQDIGSVRGADIPDFGRGFSAFDAVNILCHKTKTNSYGKVTFSRIMKDPNYFEEICSQRTMYRFPGRGQKPTPCLTIRGLQRLLMILGSKVASNFRQIAEETFSRVMAGDTSLLQIIKDNAASDQPIHKAYRAALVTSIKRFEHKPSSRFFQQKHARSTGFRKARSSKKTSLLIRKGYVYATKSDAFPGLIKIGRTNNMKKRLAQLNTACAPKPHSVVVLAPSLHCARDEQAAHKFFADRRCEGEFFRVEAGEVTAYFKTTILTRYNDELQQKLCF